MGWPSVSVMVPVTTASVAGSNVWLVVSCRSNVQLTSAVAPGASGSLTPLPIGEHAVPS